MNYHELVDVGTVTLSSLLLRNSKFFARSLESPAIGDVVVGAEVQEDGPPVFSEQDVQTVSVETSVGAYEASYLPWQWRGQDQPTLLYHHGSGERPFDFDRFSSNSFRRLFAVPEVSFPGNLIVLRAPFHDQSSWSYAQSMGTLGDFVGMLAASTALTETLQDRLISSGSPAVTVAGISLGGWVTNLHRTFFGSADRYAPIFAGAGLGEMFVSSVYRRMTGSLARENPQRLRRVLDFEEAFHKVENDDCSPLLARYDRIIEFDRQKASYSGMDVSVIDKGHMTGSLATDLLREWLERQFVSDR